jgi:hypothetical protein
VDQFSIQGWRCVNIVDHLKTDTDMVVVVDADEVDITAHHEAGHAVAAVMRGGGVLVSITIDPTEDYLGHTQFRVKRWDAAFATFAGPWAEARSRWPGGEVDDDGCVLDDYVTAAFMANPNDLSDYGDHLERERNQYGGHWPEVIHPGKREAWWSTELEGCWPVIQAVARLLLNGETVGHDTVEGLLHGHWESGSSGSS